MLNAFNLSKFNESSSYVLLRWITSDEISMRIVQTKIKLRNYGEIVIFMHNDIWTDQLIFNATWHRIQNIHASSWQRYMFVRVLKQRSGPIIHYQGINTSWNYSNLCSFRHDVRSIDCFYDVNSRLVWKSFHRNFFVSRRIANDFFDKLKSCKTMSFTPNWKHILSQGGGVIA